MYFHILVPRLGWICFCPSGAIKRGKRWIEVIKVNLLVLYIMFTHLYTDDHEYHIVKLRGFMRHMKPIMIDLKVIK